MSRVYLILEECIGIELFVAMEGAAEKSPRILTEAIQAFTGSCAATVFQKWPPQPDSRAPHPEKTYNAVAMAGSHNGHAKNRKAAPIQ